MHNLRGLKGAVTIAQRDPRPGVVTKADDVRLAITRDIHDKTWCSTRQPLWYEPRGVTFFGPGPTIAFRWPGL